MASQMSHFAFWGQWSLAFTIQPSFCMQVSPIAQLNSCSQLARWPSSELMCAPNLLLWNCLPAALIGLPLHFESVKSQLSHFPLLSLACSVSLVCVFVSWCFLLKPLTSQGKCCPNHSNALHASIDKACCAIPLFASFPCVSPMIGNSSNQFHAFNGQPAATAHAGTAIVPFCPFNRWAFHLSLCFLMVTHILFCASPAGVSHLIQFSFIISFLLPFLCHLRRLPCSTCTFTMLLFVHSCAFPASLMSAVSTLPRAPDLCITVWCAWWWSFQPLRCGLLDDNWVLDVDDPTNGCCGCVLLLTMNMTSHDSIVAWMIRTLSFQLLCGAIGSYKP